MSRSANSILPLPKSKLEWSIASIIVVAGLMGGGGVAYGFFNLIVQLTALAALAANREAFFQFWTSAPLLVRLLLAMTLAIALFQLIPLPPSIWQSLPGRELAIEARNLANASGWYPLSLDSGRTLVALTACIVPLTVVCLGYDLSRRALFRLCWLVVGLGLLNFSVGVPQILSGGGNRDTLSRKSDARRPFRNFRQSEYDRTLFGFGTIDRRLFAARHERKAEVLGQDSGVRSHNLRCNFHPLS